MAHTDEETRRWIAQRVLPQTELWLAETRNGAVVGMLVLDGEWVDQLYIESGLTGQGIGSELITLAIARAPERSAAVDIPVKPCRPTLLRATRL